MSKCFQLYFKYPQAVNSQDEVNEAATSCKKLCENESSSGFCHEVGKLSEVRKLSENQDQMFEWNRCIREFLDQTAYMDKDGNVRGMNQNSFTIDELQKDIISHGPCPGINTTLPSYGDLEATMISMHEQNSIDINKWLGMLLRTTAIKKQIENHCDIYGGPLDHNIPHCGEFTHTIKGVLSSNPNCQQTGDVIRGGDFTDDQIKHLMVSLHKNNLPEEDIIQVLETMFEFEDPHRTTKIGNYLFHVLELCN